MKWESPQAFQISDYHRMEMAALARRLGVSINILSARSSTGEIAGFYPVDAGSIPAARSTPPLPPLPDLG